MLSANFALRNPKKVDSLLGCLNDIAVAYEHYEYGLPLHNESVRAQMREAIYQWLLASEEELKGE